MEYTIGSVVFDDWVIEQIIGQGSYGSVYKIRKSEYGVTTYSALKVIKIPQSSADIRSALSEGMDNQTVTSYFQGIVDDIVHEIAIMSQVKGHPNIVSYEDHKIAVRENEIGWDILIRMELLTGLIDYQLSHPIGERDVLQIAVDISEALAFCERKGLIHRDIKPENIFVSEIGAFKIGDFGVAKTAEKAASTQSRKGTEIYMAPEVYMGRPYDQNVDIYSLGLVLYRYLNDNRLPFYPQAGIPIRPGDRENALLERMKGTPIPAPAHGSDGLCKIVLKACEYDPARRYRSAGEMLTDLKALTVPPADGFTQPESNASQPQGSYARPERNASQPKSGYARPESNASQPGSGSAQRRPDPNAYYAGAGSYSEQEGTTGMFGSTGNPGSRKSSGKAAGVKRDIREDYGTTGMFGEPENNGSASRESYGSTNSGNTNHRAANSGATTNGNATHGAANSGTANSGTATNGNSSRGAANWQSEGATGMFGNTGSFNRGTTDRNAEQPGGASQSGSNAAYGSAPHGTANWQSEGTTGMFGTTGSFNRGTSDKNAEQPGGASQSGNNGQPRGNAQGTTGQPGGYTAQGGSGFARANAGNAAQGAAGPRQQGAQSVRPNPRAVWEKYLPQIATKRVPHWETETSLTQKGLQYVLKKITVLPGETIVGIVYGSFWDNITRVLATDKGLYLLSNSPNGRLYIRYEDIKDVKMLEETNFTNKLKILKKDGQIVLFNVYYEFLNLKPICDALLQLRS